MTGRVFSIEEFSTFDGPGIRTTVFFKGCPLRCVWCHNPEGQRGTIEYMRSPNGCSDCGACLRAGKEETGTPCLSPKSVLACPNGLVRQSGIDYTPEVLAQKLTKNARILSASGGGITLSGGEPLVHASFLLALVPLLRQGGITSIALQTCGYSDADTFSRALDACDYVLYDLKLFDPTEHLALCGVGNDCIKENYRTLVQSKKSFVTRIPLIPGVTDTEHNLEALAAFIASCGVSYVEVLPYNKLTGSKYGSLLRTYAPCFDEQRECNLGEEIFQRYGITAKKM